MISHHFFCNEKPLHYNIIKSVSIYRKHVFVTRHGSELMYLLIELLLYVFKSHFTYFTVFSKSEIVTV